MRRSVPDLPEVHITHTTSSNHTYKEQDNNVNTISNMSMHHKCVRETAHIPRATP